MNLKIAILALTQILKLAHDQFVNNPVVSIEATEVTQPKPSEKRKQVKSKIAILSLTLFAATANAAVFKPGDIFQPVQNSSYQLDTDMQMWSRAYGPK